MSCVWILAFNNRQHAQAMSLLHGQQLVSQRHLFIKRRSAKHCGLSAERKESAIVSVQVSAWEWVAFDESGSFEATSEEVILIYTQISRLTNKMWQFDNVRMSKAKL